jgi:prolyl-tRNA editing enzyme YbaK/EbsC (Cys-tRNA(Pro) deacylase)
MRGEILDFGDFIRHQNLHAEIVAPGVHMPSVGAAAAAMAVKPERIFKSILFQSPAGRCVLVVACGNARVDVQRVQEATRVFGLRLAKPDVVFARTGYPAGGTPPVGHRERFSTVVDMRVAAQAWGYAGGGRPELLVKIRSADIIRLNDAIVADVTTKDPTHLQQS